MIASRTFRHHGARGNEVFAPFAFAQAPGGARTLKRSPALPTVSREISAPLTHPEAWPCCARRARASACSERPGDTTTAASGSRRDVPASSPSGVPTRQEVPGQSPPEPSKRQAWMNGERMIEEERPTWGVLDTSGQGISLYQSEMGSVALSAYALVRYIDQRPAEQNFTDHLGNVRPVDTRRDFQFHRAMVHLKGWFYSPKFRYQLTTWTVMSTDQTTLYGLSRLPVQQEVQPVRRHQHARRLPLGDGLASPLAGQRSCDGGRVLPGQLRRIRVGQRRDRSGPLVSPFIANNLSQLGITAKQLSRDIGTGYGMWWMPSTHEFGPNGWYGDWEYHEQLATRFGFSHIRSRENRQEVSDNTPENTQVRLADSLLLSRRDRSHRAFPSRKRTGSRCPSMRVSSIAGCSCRPNTTVALSITSYRMGPCR